MSIKNCVHVSIFCFPGEQPAVPKVQIGPLTYGRKLAGENSAPAMSSTFSCSFGLISSPVFSSCGNLHHQVNVPATPSNHVGEYPSSSSPFVLSTGAYLKFQRSSSSTISSTRIHSFGKSPRDDDGFEYYRELKLEREKRDINNRTNDNQLDEIRFADRFSNTEKADVPTVKSLSGVERDSRLHIPSEKEQILERPRNVGGRQMMNRSNVIAKQVISVQSALSLGYVSQLWIDTNAWVVLLVEVRPNLFSGEIECCFLEDIKKVGDVLLVGDESVLDNDFKLVGLETLVGYTVETPDGRTIGKVRGYNFDINSGSIKALELDSFGLHLIPSSLVSTYALYVEDVLEVSYDTVVVHEAAASRIHRLSKGIWGKKSIAAGCDGQEYEEEAEEEEEDGGEKRGGQRKKASGNGNGDPNNNKKKKKKRKVHENMVKTYKEWQMPMDFL